MLGAEVLVCFARKCRRFAVHSADELQLGLEIDVVGQFQVFDEAGGADVVAGITTADDYPEVIFSKPAYSALPVDFERIVALNPDAVFATTQVNAPRDADTFDAVELP